MKSKEDQLIPWMVSKNNIPDKMYVEGMHDDYEGFRVLLKGENTEMLRITFKNKISYMNTDESYRLDIGRNDTINEAHFNRVFYTVQNSSYIKWIKKTSKQSVGPDVKHFAIYTDFDCIDIITHDVPIVEWLG